MRTDDSINNGRRTFLKHVVNGTLLSVLSGCGIFPAQNPVSKTCAGKECGELDVGYGTKIYYEFSRINNEKPTIVFSHGFNGSFPEGYTFLDKNDFSVLTFSYTGHYRSGAFPPEIGNTIPNAVSSLEKLLEHAKERDFITGENEVFIGFSMGAKILENYLSKHPEERRGFVLINGQDAPCGKNTIDLLDASITLQYFLNPFVDLRAKFEYIRSLSEVDSSKNFRRCTNPTLIIASKLDELIPVEDMRAMAAEKQNSKYYELADESHIPSQEGIERIQEVIYGNIDFLMSGVRG